MLAGPENENEQSICNTYSSYSKCNFSSNKLDIMDMRLFLRDSHRLQSC